MDKKRTVFIVGGNSMIGTYVVNVFLKKGWDVYATLTNKRKLKGAFLDNVTYLELNLEKTSSITKVVKKVLRSKCQIDVLVNAAGIVFSGPLESFSEKQIRTQMDVNFFGVVKTIQEFLPSMRAHRSGVIINVSSLCGLVTFPMLSLYHASKWALEGLTESLYYELLELNIKVKLIEPGGVKLAGEVSAVKFPEKHIDDYKLLMNKVHNSDWFPSFSSPDQIADVIYKAATDETNQLRYLIGKESIAFIKERNDFISDESYLKSMKNRIIK